MTISRCGSAYLVRLPEPLTVDAAQSPGLPFVHRNGSLVAFDDDAHAVRVGRDQVLRFMHGEVAAVPIGESIDPAAWIDTSAFTDVGAESLGEEPAPPRVVAPPEERDVRVLFDVPPLAEPSKLAGLIEALKAPRARPIGGGSGSSWFSSFFSGGGTRTNEKPTMSQLPGRWLVLIVLWLIVRIGASDSGERGVLLAVVVAIAIVALAIAAFIGFARAPRAAASFTSGGVSRPAEISTVAGGQQRPSRIRKLFTRFLTSTRLTWFIGRAHSKYLMKMLSLFDDNDLDQALRHAIPLGGGGPSAGLALSPSGPRLSLDISFGRGGAAYGVPLDHSVYALLQRRYRDAFERLDQRGRYDDAAFVLAELLHANEEAVAYLERRGQFRKAAMLAEARNLSPDLIVRQWMVARDHTRAIALARLLGAFGPAVTRLEKTHPSTARLLRGHWGEWLASAGRYSLAVDVVWGLDELRGVAAAWIDHAIDQGGAVAGRMLVRSLFLQPEIRSVTLARIVELLEDEQPQQIPLRIAICQALQVEGATPEVCVAARAGVRAALRDAPLGINPSDLRKLADHARDGALRVDVPKPPLRQYWQANQTLDVDCEALDTGALAAYDVAVLNDGRVAAALGEAGVRVYSRDGRPVAHYDQPAYALVIADGRDRAIAIAGRGGITRLARIDFAGRRASHWCDTRLTQFARDYDGGAWFAARGRELLAIDATAPGLDALWHNPDYPANPLSITRSEKHLAVLGLDPGGGWHAWGYELPSLTLRERSQPKLPDGAVAVLGPDSKLLMTNQKSASLWRGEQQGLTLATHELEPFEAFFPLAAGHWLAFDTRHTGKGPRIFLCDGTDGRVRARFAMHGDVNLAVTVRFQPGYFSIADALGRVVVLDLVRGVVTHDLRT